MEEEYHNKLIKIEYFKDSTKTHMPVTRKIKLKNTVQIVLGFTGPKELLILSAFFQTQLLIF